MSRARSAALLAGFLGALATLGACSEDSRGPAAPDDVLALAASAAAIPADGVSLVTITAVIPAGAAPANRTIAFTTTAGTFAGTSPPGTSIEVPADVDGRAVVSLQSGTQPAEARVQASVAGFVRTVTVRFTQALPETIDVDPGTFSLEPGFANTTTVTATLRRSGGGVATQGTEVRFTATTPAGAAVGEFRAVTPSDAQGRATALYTAGDTAHRGPVTIAARVTDPATGATVAGTATLQIVDPPAAPGG
jgi:hypothetical protein